MRLPATPRLAIAAVFVAIVVIPFHGHAQNRDTVETRVTVEGAVVTLDWGKNHPWSPLLQTRGVALVAEYRTVARGVVSEVLGASTARKAEERTVQFRLPDALAGVPAGPVCLFMQLPDRRLLPIRKANKSGDDTARFRYEAWEKAAARQSEAAAARVRIASSERDLTTKSSLVATQQALVTQNKWQSVQACEAIPAPQTSTLERPYDAIEPAEQEDIARRVCVSRVAWAERELESLLSKVRAKTAAGAAEDYLQLAISVVRSPAVVDEQLFAWAAEAGADDANVKARLVQADQFRRDWTRWSTDAASYVTPHVGERGDSIPLQSTASDAGFRILGTSIVATLGATLKNEPMPTATDRPGYVGGSLEAYSRCVTEARSQLRTKYDNWISLRASAPTRAASAREQLVGACREGLTRLERLLADQRAAAATLDRDKETLTSLSVPLPLRDKPQVLNLNACSLN